VSPAAVQARVRRWLVVIVRASPRLAARARAPAGPAGFVASPCAPPSATSAPAFPGGEW
jgi:hypothetical protein